MTPGGLGRVHTQRAVLFDDAHPLVLQSGRSLPFVEVAYETYGALDSDGGNAVFVCHALSGDAHAAGHHGDPDMRGWWDTIIGPGRPLDTERFFVVCPNLLGGCSGTTGPTSVDPRTSRPYGLGFPLLTVRDLVAVHRALLEHIGISRLHGAIGGSLGGMQVLQWALDHPEQIERAVLVCASASLNAQNIALTAIARAAIMGDPDFQEGRYLEGPRVPVAAGRQRPCSRRGSFSLGKSGRHIPMSREVAPRPPSQFLTTLRARSPRGMHLSRCARGDAAR